jgi:uncharacterized membrane protein
MDLLVVKTIHILSAFLLCGAGFGVALHYRASHVSQDVRSITHAHFYVDMVDWLFTTPALFLQPLTGLWLADLEGISFDTPWIVAACWIYVVVPACWLPSVWLQLKMSNMATASLIRGDELPPRYRRLHQAWFLLGWPAFAAMLAITVLMVVRPEW